MKLQVLTNSELGTWRDCRARHGYMYIDRLRPHYDSWPLKIGTILHAGLEAGVHSVWADHGGSTLPTAEQRAGIAAIEGTVIVEQLLKEHQRDMEQLLDDGAVTIDEFERRMNEAEEAVELGRFMLSHYFQATASDFDTLVPLAVEHQFHVPVPDTLGRPRHLYLDGKIDLVCWDLQHGAVVVRDWKTTSSDPDSFEKRLAVDPQMTGYLHGVRDMLRRGQLQRMDGGLLPEDVAERVAQVQYDVLRRKAPGQPKVNKIKKADLPDGYSLDRLKAEKEREEAEGCHLGLVSADKRLDTLAAVYEAALEEQERERGLPRTEAQETLLTVLTQKGDTFFRRFEYWRDPAETERWRGELWIEARQIREARKDPSHRTRNPGYCAGYMPKRCEYQSVCLQDGPETRSAFRVADTEHEELRHGNGNGNPGGSGSEHREGARQSRPPGGAGEALRGEA